MDDTQIWAYIDEQRADLADFLDTLSAEQWETPSLCPGWTVREVAAHITQSTTELGKADVRTGALRIPVQRGDAEDGPRRPADARRDHRRAAGDGRRSPQAAGDGDGGPADGRARARTGHRHTPWRRTRDAHPRRGRGRAAGVDDGVSVQRPQAFPERERSPRRTPISAWAPVKSSWLRSRASS